MSLNLNLRGDLGRKLTISELDSNFSNIQDAINNGTSGSSKTFQLKAHSSLTTDDIGKFVISYSDPSWNDYIIGGGTPSSFTGSYNEARLPFLSGTSSGTNGKWTIDFAATYGGKDWEQLQDNERFIEIQFSNQLIIFKYNHFVNFKGFPEDFNGYAYFYGNPVYNLLDITEEKWNKFIYWCNEYDAIDDQGKVIPERMEEVYNKLGLTYED